MKISEEKKEKISEQILAYLFSINPKPVFTKSVAHEIARDEEFSKKLLLQLKKNRFVKEIKSNPKGIPYSKRSRWILTDETYMAYKNLNI